MRYIKALLVRLHSLLHCGFVKFLHLKTFHFCLEEIIAFSVHFVIRDSGTISIGKKCGMRRGCEIMVSENGHINIGNEVFLNKGCIIAAHDNIVIGNKTRFGPYTMIFDHDYDYKNSDVKKRDRHISAPVIIGNNVWIGAGVIILKGTKIGDNCVVGAGCVLKGNYEPKTVIIQKSNVDIKEIKYVEECVDETCTSNSR